MSLMNSIYVSRRTAAAFTVVGLFWGTFAAYVPVLKERIGANDALFGMLLLGSGIGLVTAMWVTPKIDRHWGARGVQISAVLLSLMWLFPGLITAPAVFAVTMVFVGLASGLVDVLMNARVSELEAKSGRSLMNVNHAVFSLAYAVAALASGLAREVGLPPFTMMAGVAAVCLILIAPFLRMEVDPVSQAPRPEGRYPLWPILLSGFIVLVAFSSEATVEAWSALHIERTLGGGAAEGALGPAMLGLTMAFGRFSGQVVAERLREVQVIVCGAMLASAGAFIAATASVPAMAYAGFGILGLGVSVVGPMGLALVGKLVAPELRTEAISRVAVMGFSGFFFAPVAMGLLSQAFGLATAFALVGFWLLLALPATALLVQIARARPA